MDLVKELNEIPDFSIPVSKIDGVGGGNNMKLVPDATEGNMAVFDDAGQVVDGGAVPVPVVRDYLTLQTDFDSNSGRVTNAKSAGATINSYYNGTSVNAWNGEWCNLFTLFADVPYGKQVSEFVVKGYASSSDISGPDDGAVTFMGIVKLSTLAASAIPTSITDAAWQTQHVGIWTEKISGVIKRYLTWKDGSHPRGYQQLNDADVYETISFRIKFVESDVTAYVQNETVSLPLFSSFNNNHPDFIALAGANGVNGNSGIMAVYAAITSY